MYFTHKERGKGFLLNLTIFTINFKKTSLFGNNFKLTKVIKRIMVQRTPRYSLTWMDLLLRFNPICLIICMCLNSLSALAQVLPTETHARMGVHTYTATVFPLNALRFEGSLHTHGPLLLNSGMCIS